MTPAAAHEQLAAGPAGAFVRQAHAAVADLTVARPALFYADLVVSAAVAWGSLIAGAARLPSWSAAPLLALAALALYRAASFIHEITHLRPGAVPGFTPVWNALVGVPLLLPSLLYVGVHNVHHAKVHYGTLRDPEYIPLGRWPRWKLVLWVAHAALLPVALVARFLLLAPLALLAPGLRRWVWGKASSLTVNPAWTRPPAPPAQRAGFLAQELACVAWGWGLVALVRAGALPARYPLAAAAAAGAVGVLNQLRTAVAHRFRNEGADMSFEEQFLDSVNVPGSPLLTELWAPVGLRYHALHHLLPGLPYHSLGRAHRRLVAVLPPGTLYPRTCEPSLAAALRARDRGARRASRTSPSPGP